MNVAMRISSCLVFWAAMGAGFFASTAAGAADQALIDAAKKEAQVTWYTSLIIDQVVRPAADAFEKKYGVKVNYVRGGAPELALRIQSEATAGRLNADLLDGTNAVVALKKQGELMKWIPSGSQQLGEGSFDPDGYWVANCLYVLTPGFNTDLIKRGTEPRTFEALLDPKLKGHMVWGALPQASAAHGFVGLALAHFGDEAGQSYLRKLAAQNITSVEGSARQVLDQVIAGEYSLALQIFNYHSSISAAKGAPVDWIFFEHAMSTVSAMAITKSAPHPNAAKLLLDFLISPEGQTVFRNAGYIPVHPDISAAYPRTKPDGKTFKVTSFSPEKLDAEIPKWNEIYHRLFR